jgi:hypothetical protein
MMSRMKAVHIAFAGLLAFSLTACGSLSESGAASGAQGGGGRPEFASHAASAVTPARPRTAVTVVYVVPPPRQPADADVFVQTVPGGTLGGVRLTQAINVRATPLNRVSDSSTAILQTFDYAGRARAIGLGLAGNSSSVAGRTATTSVSIATDDGGLYRQVGAQIEVLDPSFRRTGLMNVPAPLPGAGTQDGQPTKRAIRASSGEVAAFLIGPDGHVYALTTNGVNGTLADLTAGRRTELPAYGQILGATTDAEGRAYVLMRDVRLSRNTFVVAELDLAALRTGTLYDTGVGVTGGTLDDISLLASRQHGLLVYAAGHDAGGAPRATLLRFNGTSFDQVAVPAASGSRATVGVDDRVYLYSGPGGNRVTTVDLDTGRAAVDPVLSAPEGTFVMAVFVL